MLAFDIPNFGTREDFGFPLVSILTSLCRHQSSIMIEIRKYAKVVDKFECCSPVQTLSCGAPIVSKN